MRLFALVLAGIFLPACPELYVLPSGNEDAVKLKTDSEIFAEGVRKKVKNIEPDMVIMVIIKGDILRQPSEVKDSKFVLKVLNESANYN